MSQLHQISKRFTRIFDQQVAVYEQYARQHGLQGKGLYILLWIYYNPQGITQKLISEKTYSTKQVVNATIRNWVAKGYLTCQENPKDKRHKLLKLTEEGKQYAATILDPLEEMEMQAMGSLTAEEQLVFLQIFDKYSQSIAALFSERRKNL